MSMSGALVPCVPLRFYLKFNPAKITLVYHLEKKEKEQFYHDMLIPRNMLENESDDEICTHLYLAESYYLDPKVVRRQQIIGLIKKLKEGIKRPKQDAMSA